MHDSCPRRLTLRARGENLVEFDSSASNERLVSSALGLLLSLQDKKKRHDGKRKINKLGEEHQALERLYQAAQIRPERNGALFLLHKIPPLILNSLPVGRLI